MFRASVALALCAGLASCAAPVVVATSGFSVLQAGTSAFISGELEAAIPKPIAEVFEAADASLRELQFTLGAAKLDEYNGYLYARETQRRRIEITMEKKSPVVTKLNIRIGVFGDQAVSRLILATIQSKLAPGTEKTSGVITGQ
jgi:hypothetical protein